MKNKYISLFVAVCLSFASLFGSLPFMAYAEEVSETTKINEVVEEIIIAHLEIDKTLIAKNNPASPNDKAGYRTRVRRRRSLDSAPLVDTHSNANANEGSASTSFSEDAIRGGTENIPVGEGNQAGAYGVRILLKLDTSSLSTAGLEKWLSDSNNQLSFVVKWKNALATKENLSISKARENTVLISGEVLEKLKAGDKISLGDYHLYYKDQISVDNVYDFTVAYVPANKEVEKSYLRIKNSFNAEIHLLTDDATKATKKYMDNTLSPNQIINNSLTINLKKREDDEWPKGLTGAFYRETDSLMRLNTKINLNKEKPGDQEGNRLDPRKRAYKTGDEENIKFKLDGQDEAEGVLTDAQGRIFKYKIVTDILNGSSLSLVEKVKTVFKNPDNQQYGEIATEGAESGSDSNTVTKAGFYGDALTAPKVTMKTDETSNKYSFVGFSPTFSSNKFDDTKEYTAVYKEKVKPVDNPDNPDSQQPEEGYVRIFFNADAEKGYFGSSDAQKTKIALDVLIGTDKAYVLSQVPSLTAKIGFIKTDNWQPDLPETFAKEHNNREYTAQYIKSVEEVSPKDPTKPFNPANKEDGNNNRDKDEKYVRIIFDAGQLGNFGMYTGTQIPIKQKAFDVVKGTAWEVVARFAPSLESVKANPGLKAYKWNPQLPADDTKMEADAKYEVRYLAIDDDEDEDNTPEVNIQVKDKVPNTATGREASWIELLTKTFLLMSGAWHK